MSLQHPLPDSEVLSTPDDFQAEQNYEYWGDVASLFPPAASPAQSEDPSLREMPSTTSIPLTSYNVVVANRPLTAEPFLTIWQKAKLRICADGGANRLFDLLASDKRGVQDGLSREHFLPQVIKGDLDSLRPSVRSFYAQQGVRIVHDRSQDTTDLEKSFEEIEMHQAMAEDQSDESSVEVPVTVDAIFGGLGGNFTQLLSNFVPALSRPHRRVVFADDRNVVVVLQPGSHYFVAPVGTKCGLLPLGGSCASITTNGLVWELSNSKLSFDGLISSSNVTKSTTIRVRNSDPVLWTFDFNYDRD